MQGFWPNHPYFLASKFILVAKFRKPEIQHLLRCLQLAVLFIQLRLVALHLLYFWLFQQTLPKDVKSRIKNGSPIFTIKFKFKTGL
jgi:hypothetical protein